MMRLYRVADLYVAVDFRYEETVKKSAAYESKDRPEVIDVVLNISDESFQKTREELSALSKEDVEYVYTGSIFYHALIEFGGLMLHSSAVVVDGYAYLFSADSGTGKSTHTELWLKKFGERAYILNDDKPAIRIEDGVAYAYGTPWSGKNDINKNAKAKLKGICFISRGEKNEIEKVDSGSIIPEIMKQTIRPSNEKIMDLLLNNIEKLLEIVPFYRMKCNMDIEAAEVAFGMMNK